MVLLGETAVPSHQFKAQMTSNSKFLQRNSEEVKKTDPSELARLKLALPDKVLGKRAREALLGGIDLVCAFLSHHGKTELGAMIKHQLPSAVAFAMMPQSNMQHGQHESNSGDGNVAVARGSLSSNGTTTTTGTLAPQDSFFYGLSEADTPP